MASIVHKGIRDRAPRGAALTDREFHARLEASVPHLRAFARSLCRCRDLADDLTQETLLMAWAARDRFVAGTNFKAWTFTILRNIYGGQRRRSRFVGDYNEVEAEQRLCTPPTQLAGLEATDVLRALMLLPVPQREALVLMAVGQLSYEDIAMICGVAIGTIKSRIARARAALSAVLESGQMPDARHAFVLKGEILDAYTAMLQDMACRDMMVRRAS